MPTVIDEENAQNVVEPRVIITSIAADSPAALAGFLAGDEVVFIESQGEGLQDEALSVEAVQAAVADSGEGGIALQVLRNGESIGKSLTPVDGFVEGKKAIGVGLAEVGLLKFPVHKAIWRGAVVTVEMTRDVAVGLVVFFYQAITGQANLDQVAGPVGIAGLVGDAARVGFVQLMSFTAFISINLAVLNMLPFPALDGGRLLFVLIEKIKGKAIEPKIANTVNAVGFALLLLLMLVVTYKDIARLF